MAKLTQKQVESWNSQCSNGFEISIYDYVVRNEKCVNKVIFLNEEHTERVSVDMYFVDRRGEKFIAVHYSHSILNEEKTFWCGKGLGYTEYIRYEKDKKQMKDIFALTSEYTDKRILATYRENELKLKSY